jgi:hypothetical protein
MPRLAKEILDLPERTCIECNLIKSQEDFFHNGGHHTWCSECDTEHWRRLKREAYHRMKQDTEKYEKHRSRLKSNSHRRSFSFLSDEYDRLFKLQDGFCAYCGQLETATNKKSGLVLALAVDHNHATGEPRALLCRSCNIAFGFMEENPERIRLLLQYAQKWSIDK